MKRPLACGALAALALLLLARRGAAQNATAAAAASVASTESLECLDRRDTRCGRVSWPGAWGCLAATGGRTTHCRWRTLVPCQGQAAQRTWSALECLRCCSRLAACEPPRLPRSAAAAARVGRCA